MSGDAREAANLVLEPGQRWREKRRPWRLIEVTADRDSNGSTSASTGGKFHPLCNPGPSLCGFDHDAGRAILGVFRWSRKTQPGKEQS